MTLRLSIVALLAAAMAAGAVHAEDPRPEAARQPHDFKTFFVTRSLGHPRLIEFMQAARPEVVQIGNYGAMFHGFAADPRSTKSPMMLPVAGERAALEFQRKLNAQVHKLGSKVVGHFRLIKVMGDWEQRSGFADWYDNHWPQDLLGPKPHPRLIELLQRDADGAPVQVSRYDNAQLTLCLSSPHARRMLKAMLKCAVDHGVDGVVTNYNYRFSCACPHCQTAFKKWLRERHSAAEIQDKLGIERLDGHRFRAIPARIPGCPDPAESGELEWLAMRWGAEHFKRMFDDVFIDYGRSLRKDLIVAQWNHLSHVSVNEERMFLPASLWNRGEDYFWYSGGAAFVGRNLNLGEGKAGDAWLSSLYVRELSGGRPFVIGKYDRVRMAASLAEGWATGGAGMGRYMRFEQPDGYDVLVRYLKFMHRRRELYEGARPWADAALVLPRQSVWNRRPDALDAFRELGQQLVQRQVLLDVLADENLTPQRLSTCRAVVLPSALSLSDEQLAALRSYAAGGGRVLQYGEAGVLDELGQPRDDSRIEGAVPIDGDAETAAEAVRQRLRRDGASQIEAPWTVRAAAYAKPGQVVVHLVNYDRDESPSRELEGPQLERPRPTKNLRVELPLPKPGRVSSATLYSPDAAEPIELRASQPPARDRVALEIPPLHVYGVIAISIKE